MLAVLKQKRVGLTFYLAMVLSQIKELKDISVPRLQVYSKGT
jgi:hypothetical protein